MMLESINKMASGDDEGGKERESGKGLEEKLAFTIFLRPSFLHYLFI